MRTVAAVLILCLCGVAALDAQTARPPLPSFELPDALTRVLRDYERAWQARDAAALAALFTEDGFVLQNGKPPVRGRDAIREAYANSGGPLFLRALAYSADGVTGYIIGAYRAEKHGPDAGKFILALRLMPDGKWMIAADMDNSNGRTPTEGPAYQTLPERAALNLPYSDAVRSGNLLFLSGTVGANPATRQLVEGGVVAETRQALENVKSNLEAHGSSMDRVVKCSVFLADIADFEKMNGVYREFFPANKPARTTIGVAALPLGARVEIECVAAVH
ncbi:MAG: Rid family detoxifying hydrolase [Thermoanaerobaculia bacterium]